MGHAADWPAERGRRLPLPRGRGFPDGAGGGAASAASGAETGIESHRSRFPEAGAERSRLYICVDVPLGREICHFL